MLRIERVPAILAAVLVLAAFAVLGPIGQVGAYMEFADQRTFFGIPNAADVLSNIGFLLAGGWGLLCLSRVKGPARGAWGVFFAAIALTALGSSWFHLDPSNARLVWDRLPIAIGCASLLAVVLIERTPEKRWILPVLVAFAAASVGWWVAFDDLRPYMLVQLAPIVLVPVLQWHWKAPKAQRTAFASAIAFYVLAKVFELGDVAGFDLMAGLLSGHTIKHIMASIAAWVLIAHAVGRKSAVHHH
jgi:hypothetical protein